MEIVFLRTPLPKSVRNLPISSNLVLGLLSPLRISFEPRSGKSNEKSILFLHKNSSTNEESCVLSMCLSAESIFHGHFPMTPCRFWIKVLEDHNDNNIYNAQIP